MLNESVLVGVRVDLAFTAAYPEYRLEGGLISRVRDEGRAVDKASFAIFGDGDPPEDLLTPLLGEVLTQINTLRARIDGMESAEELGASLVRITYSIEETLGEFKLRYAPGTSSGSLGQLQVEATARQR